MTMADNVELSDAAKAFLGDLESGKLPDPDQGQSRPYNVLGMTINQSKTTSGPHGSDVAMSATTEYSVTDGGASFTVSLTNSTDVKSNLRLLLPGMNSDSDDTVTVSTSNGSTVAATSTVAASQAGDATTKPSDPAVAALVLLKQDRQAADDRSKTGEPDKTDLLDLTVINSDAG